MSRASGLRDAMIAELQTRTGYTVDAFVKNSYTREDLDESSPRIACQCAGRTVMSMQGPDSREVKLLVAVLGLVREQPTDAQRVADADTFDALVETIIGYWSPDGPLAGKALNDHRFIGISQHLQFDPDQFYNNGVFMSLLTFTFHDLFD